MNYVTVEVKFDHGRVVLNDPARLPEKGKGLLTILESSEEVTDVEKMTPLEAFKALSKSLNLDEAKAKAWMDTIRDARR